MMNMIVVFTTTYKKEINVSLDQDAIGWLFERANFF